MHKELLEHLFKLPLKVLEDAVTRARKDLELLTEEEQIILERLASVRNVRTVAQKNLQHYQEVLKTRLRRR